jgi:hypothetical protein
MDTISLRRAFRARPGTVGCIQFADFLAGLDSNELGWQRLVALLECDVLPVVSRRHPDIEADEISSTCLSGAFEVWISEWLGSVQTAALVRERLREERDDEAFAELAKHPRFRGSRAREAHSLWKSRRCHDALSLIEGKRSARSHLIARTRAQISELQRKQRRQSRLMTRHCSDALGIGAYRGRPTTACRDAHLICGAELDHTSREHSTWRVSVLPPAHLPSQDLAERFQRMLGAIDELGPEYARVFRLLLEGFSQRSIAQFEGRHPAAISRRVRSLQDLCRFQLFE